MQKESRKIRKRGVAFVLTVALVMGLIPLEITKALADEVKKAYEVIVEPTLVYDYVYGFYSGKSPVQDKNGQWGVIDLAGKEIVPCKYHEITFFGNDSLIGWDENNELVKIDYNGNVLKSFGKFNDVTFFRSDANWLLFSGNETINFINVHNSQLVANVEEYNFDDEKLVCSFTNDIKKYFTYDSKTGKESNVLPGNMDSIFLWDYSLFYKGYVKGWREYNGKYYNALIKTDGTVVFETDRFDDFGYFSDTRLIAENTGTVSLLDYEGNIVKTYGPYLEYGEDYSITVEDEKHLIIQRYNEEALNTEYILINEDGEKVLPQNDYVYITSIEDNRYLVEDTNSQWYLFDGDGKLLYSYEKADDIEWVQDGWLMVTEYGNGDDVSQTQEVIKYDGTVIIPKAENISDYGTWLEVNRGNQNCAYNRDNGKMIFQTTEEICSYNAEAKMITTVTDDSIYTLHMGQDYSTVVSGIEWMGEYHDGYLPVRINGKWGVYKINSGEAATEKKKMKQRKLKRQKIQKIIRKRTSKKLQLQ